MDVTKAKKAMLGAARTAAPRYLKLVGMTTTFVCKDGFRLPVRWEASNFAHLCGLDYFTDASRTKRYPYAKLLEHLLRGKRISERQVAPNGDARWLPCKADVLANALDLDKADAVVESGNSRIMFYAGTTIWCIGIGHDHAGGYYYPQSLVRKSYEKAMKPDTTAHPVDHVEMDPTPSA